MFVIDQNNLFRNSAGLLFIVSVFAFVRNVILVVHQIYS